MLTFFLIFYTLKKKKKKNPEWPTAYKTQQLTDVTALKQNKNIIVKYFNSEILLLNPSRFGSGQCLDGRLDGNPLYATLSLLKKFRMMMMMNLKNLAVLLDLDCLTKNLYCIPSLLNSMQAHSDVLLSSRGLTPK